MIVNIETFIQDPIQWYTLISTDRSKAIMNMKFAKRLIWLLYAQYVVSSLCSLKLEILLD